MYMSSSKLQFQQSFCNAQTIEFCTNTIPIFKHSNASLIKFRSVAHTYAAPGINKIPAAEVPYLYSNYKRTAIAEEGFLFTNNITSRFKRASISVYYT